MCEIFHSTLLVTADDDDQSDWDESAVKKYSLVSHSLSIVAFVAVLVAVLVVAVYAAVCLKSLHLVKHVLWIIKLNFIFIKSTLEVQSIHVRMYMCVYVCHTMSFIFFFFDWNSEPSKVQKRKHLCKQLILYVRLKLNSSTCPSL